MSSRPQALTLPGYSELVSGATPVDGEGTDGWGFRVSRDIQGDVALRAEGVVIEECCFQLSIQDEPGISSEHVCGRGPGSGTVPPLRQ